ncbi:MAG: helix-turn-helix transcriptional regulator [bacterium]|nr:helix-turn-helix transcriptional regulator [bacterium]
MIVIKLDDLMWERRTTAEAIAKATGLGSSTISKLRNSKNTNISINTLDKLCRYFNCKLTDLIDYIP